MTTGKRSHGEGNVRKRGNRWQGRITVTVDGEQKTIAVTRDTRKEAVDELRAIHDRVAKGQPGQDTAMTFGLWIDAWCEGPLRASTREVGTQDQYTSLLKTHAKPVLGDVPLKHLRASHLEALIAKVGAVRAASTTRSLYAALRACLAGAVRDKLIASNPMTEIARPKASAPKPRALPVEQVKKLNEAAKVSRLANFILLDALTGLRRGELCGLRWVDVDLDAERLHVTGALIRDSNGLRRKTPKTTKSLRTVSLAPGAVAALKRQRAVQNAERLAAGSAWIESGYVFTTAEGGAVEPRNVSREYALVAKRAGVADKGMHALRHYAATAWLSSGEATVRDVADMLGHSSPVVTLEIYAAAVPKSQAAAINAAAQALG